MKDMVKKRRRSINRKSGFSFIKIFVVLIFLGFLATGYIWQRVTVLKLTRGIKKIKSEMAEKEKRCKYLEIEIADLFSVKRIEDFAHLKLGLSYPRTHQIVFLEESNLVKTKKNPNKFDLVQYFKKIIDKVLDVPENSLEAKEIKRDL